MSKINKNNLYGAHSIFKDKDYEENYGRHLIYKFFKNKKFKTVLDIGCGNGDDLLEMQKISKNIKCYGIDFNLNKNKTLKLKNKNINAIKLNIEAQKFPIKSNTVDVVIANQVLEHTKELFWINHEIFRVLKNSGYLYIGVPNGLAFHNRILGLFGHHPRSSKIISAHIRFFSRHDTVLFYNSVLGKKVELRQFYGSQFYPFNIFIARILSYLFPSLSTSIFFIFKKKAKYSNEFIKWLNLAKLETNYYQGKR